MSFEKRFERDPSKRKEQVKCPACSGRGSVTREGKTMRCEPCNGTGIRKTSY